MSVKDFVKDPYKYSKAHIVTFYGGETLSPSYGGVGAAATGMEVVQTYDRWSGGWKALHYAMTPGTFTEFRFQQTFDKSISAWGQKRVGSGSGHMHTVTAFPSTLDRGIRFLPWSENHVTFMALDDGAQTFFTGPLSGCAIYTGQDPSGQWWAFHANRNNMPNSAVKGSMTKLTIDAAGLQVTVRHSAIYKMDYHDQGFVFGQKKAGNWSFYVCDVASKAAAGHYASKVTRI